MTPLVERYQRAANCAESIVSIQKLATDIYKEFTGDKTVSLLVSHFSALCDASERRKECKLNEDVSVPLNQALAVFDKASTMNPHSVSLQRWVP